MHHPNSYNDPSKVEQVKVPKSPTSTSMTTPFQFSQTQYRQSISHAEFETQIFVESNNKPCKSSAREKKASATAGKIELENPSQVVLHLLSAMGGSMVRDLASARQCRIALVDALIL